MASEKEIRAAVFMGLLQLAERLGTVEHAHMCGSLFSVEGVGERGRFYFSLQLEEDG